MSAALLVIGNGRTEMLDRTVESARQFLPAFPHLLMIDDSGDPEVAEYLDARYPEFAIEHHGTNQGMAAAVQAGFDLVLSTSAAHVFWLEEDQELIAAPPVEDALEVLNAHEHVAQMYFRREVGPEERDRGCVLASLIDVSNGHTVHGAWTEHDGLFVMGPNIIPREVLELGWPAGPIGVGNEQGMTDRLLRHGYTFGAWGAPCDGQVWVRHIGYAARAREWRL